MKDKTFIIKFFLTLTLSLLAIMSLNFFVDPGNVYYRRYLIQKEGANIVNKFNGSLYGLAYKGNDRFFAALMARNAKGKDCIVIGSSHVMQISTIRGKHIKKICRNLLNLGVSSASIEDLYIFLELLDTNGNLPSKLLLGIDPWLLKWDMDSSYFVNSKYLNSFLIRHQIIKPNYVFSDFEAYLIKNLLNLEYTEKTVQQLFVEGFSFKFLNDIQYFPLDSENPLLNPLNDIGVKLKDGSHLYPKKFLAENITGSDYEKEPSYKLFGPDFDQAVVNQFEEILKEYKKKTEIIFILTPYHPSSFRSKFTKYNSYLINVEKKIRLVAQKLGIKIYGSYNPSISGCDSTEFYDYMHPTADCVDKIFR